MDINEKRSDFKSGFVAIVGAPNAGKSTLLNRMLGEKVSITSKKPQTTRNRIIGVVHRPFSQIVFIDTPGMHRAKGKLNVRIVDVALSSLSDVDIVLVLVDVSNPDPISEDFIVKQLQKKQRRIILVLNKIDLVDKSMLLAVIDKWSKAHPFEAVVPISAKHGDQVEALLDSMESLLPEGPPLFPEDTLTDMPQRFIAAEMIREKVFRLTGQEIPYSTAVTIDSFSTKKRGALVTINAIIHVEKASQKGIIIGRGGSKLKRIGEQARKDIEKMVGAKVFLKLFVHVQKDWSKDTRALRNFGY